MVTQLCKWSESNWLFANCHQTKTLGFILAKVSINVKCTFAFKKFAEPITSISIWLDAKEKTSFAEEMDKVYEKALADGVIKSGNRESIDLLMERATFAKDEAQQEETRQELEQYGTYIYEAEEVSWPPCNTSDDVTLYTPMVFYQAWEKTWTVTCGGNWNHTNQLKPVLWGDVGDEDAFGVKFTDSTQVYRSSVVRVSAYLADEDMEKKVTTYNRSDGDGSKGFSFQLQDYTYFVPFKTGYVGYKWYGSCTYDSGFGAYDGVATAYYVPT